MKQQFIGTSGYNYKEWKGDFYPNDVPQKRWLAYYAQQFSTLEVNATFYRSFNASVYQKWYSTTEKDFTFVIKGPRRITHIKRLKDVNDELDLFFSANAELREKLSCVLWQFPANYKNTDDKLEVLIQFLEKLPKSTRHALELRNVSWFTEEFYKVLRKYNVGFVINDSSHFPADNVVTADFVYIRFHGPRELYASSYTTEELLDWSDRIYNWIQTKDVYGYFNNDMGGHAFRNAKELINMLQQR